jgi:DNA-binding NtrC family response regulator
MTASSKGRILIVDDEIELMKALCDSLGEEGFRVKGVSAPKAALDELRKHDFDLLLSDLMMPEMDGIALLREALQIDPNLIGIIMTGQGTVQTAVEAMKLGAFDYILKPFKLATILPTIARAMDVRRLKLENVRLKEQIQRLTFESTRLQMIGTGPIMHKVFAMMEKVAGRSAWGPST